MNVGEIWLVELIDATGREQGGMRPAVIIAIHDVTGQVMVVPISSSAGLDRFGFVVSIKKSVQNGLSLDSTALVFQLRSLSNTRFRKKLGNLESRYMDEIKLLIYGFLGLQGVGH
jgi:mRNA interferase MazF